MVVRGKRGLSLVTSLAPKSTASLENWNFLIFENAKQVREEINHVYTKIDETYQIIGIDESPVAEAEFALKINI